MPKYRLTARFIQTADAGKHSDGGGLILVKTSKQSGKWIFRYTFAGKRREMGLGAMDQIGLAEVRKVADGWRTKLQAGLDPIACRDQEREKIRAEAEAERLRKLAAIMTFAKVTEQCFEARKTELRDGGKAGRWMSPLNTHILPKIGEKPIEEIDQTVIVDTLRPIWHEKPDVARKALNRIGIVINYASALGLNVDVSATKKAANILGKRRHSPKNIPSLPWQELPAFWQAIQEPTPAHLSLQLLILTAVRSKPVRFARYDEISNGVWTIPAENVKGLEGKTASFRVPLSDAALAVIEETKRYSGTEFLFPNLRGKGVISDMTMAKTMQRMGLDARPHGFRSSFRIWAEECTSATFEVKETCLGHSVGSNVTRSYMRSDLLDQRTTLLQKWADFVTAKDSGDVVEFRNRHNI